MSDAVPVFLYGTLLDLDLLEIVLGHPPDLRAARLPGCRSAWVAGRDFPMIYRQEGAVAAGVLLDARGDDVARMDFYEGPFSYDLADVTVECGGERVGAQTYFPAPGLYEPGADWRIEDWTQQFGAAQKRKARDIMAGFGASG